MNSSALMISSPENDDGAELAVVDEDELSACYLYFMVCAATSGPLADLVKVGIADCFLLRHRQHTATWGAFDLSRSALLRVRNRQEALDLERELRKHFGDPVAERIAKAAGKTLTSEDFIAMGSWRRHPGRRDDGHTEFYALGCLAKMLSHIENWRVASSDKRRAGTRLQRGISLTECSTRARTTDPSLTREQNRELHERSRAAVRQFEGKVRAESDKLLTRVLGFALKHQEHLLGVDLRAWRKARAMRDPNQGKYGLVNLYFRLLDDVLHRDDPRLQAWWTAQFDLQDEFAPITALAHTVGPHGRGKRVITSGGDPERRCVVDGFSEGVANFGGGHRFAELGLPGPTPSNLVQVYTGNRHSDPFHPSFETFEKLAQMVEDRRAWRPAGISLVKTGPLRSEKSGTRRNILFMCIPKPALAHPPEFNEAILRECGHQLTSGRTPTNIWLDDGGSGLGRRALGTDHFSRRFGP